MKWQGREESENVEDRRGVRPATAGVVGGLGTVIIVILGLLFGLKPDQVKEIVDAQQRAGAQAAGGAAVESTPEEDEQLRFVKVVLRDTEKVWANSSARGD